MSEKEPHPKDWTWLDDAASLAVVVAIGLGIVSVAIAIATGTIQANITADLGFKGTIDIGLLVYALLGVAMLDIWGRRRLKGAISILRGDDK